MTADNVLIQTADHREKLFIMALWKVNGTKPIMITTKDIEAFAKEFEIDAGKEPQLILHGMEDGLKFQVLGSEAAKKFVDEYKATQRGVVIDTNDVKGR
jgi:hypothetical protein